MDEQTVAVGLLKKLLSTDELYLSFDGYSLLIDGTLYDLTREEKTLIKKYIKEEVSL